jgi:cytidylate kinase
MGYRMIIAIDGPAGAGKGTLAKRLAIELGYHYLDTGLLYRAVGFLAQNMPPQEAAACVVQITPEVLANPALRSVRVAEQASKVSAQPAVRAALLEWQRQFAQQPPGAVLDGRDIGTVVCPDAPLKLFLTASPEVRAKRRVAELPEASYPEVLASIIDRDHRDSSRTIAPLRPAEDAIVLDTSEKSADAVFTDVLGYVRRKAESGCV